MKLKENLKGKKQDEKKKIVQISQEIELVQKLADNDVRMRDRAVKKLKKWLEVKTKDGGNIRL
jgi:Nucleolar protein,Nop52